MTGRHRLLERQLRRTIGQPAEASAELAELLDLVDATYRQTDEERALLEHSMDTVSEELGDRHRRLQEALNSSREQAQELTEALALLRSTVDSTEDGLLVVNERGRIVLFNRRFTEIWGIPETILASGRDDAALEHVLSQLADPESFLARVRELYANPEAESFDVLRFKDPERRIERYSRPHRMRDRTLGRVWSFRDVSKRTRLEEQLAQAQKMEAVGQLAGGIAHDFNNVLTVIFAYAEMLQESLESQPEARADVRKILEAAQRAAQLTRQLLAFARRQLLQPQVLDLNLVISELQPMLTRLIPESVRVRLDLSPSLGGIVADRGQLEQSILNLAINARDAMSAGGTLTLSSRVQEAALDSTWGILDAPGDRWIVLEISDTGAGIPRDLLPHIFEPFFTTKPVGRGTGLGLAMVYGFVQQSRGRIAVDSEVGRGTTFRLSFPRDEASATPTRTLPTREMGVGETILLVEDEQNLREVMSRTLEMHGYRVHAAADAEEALESIRSQRLSIDLLLTDVVMPGQGGAALAREVVRQLGQVRVLFISGYTDDEVLRQGVESAAVRFLPKPFTLEALTVAVRQAIQGPPTSHVD